MSEKEAWIRLLVKYKGKCKECGKEIPLGEYALWSKTSKAIKHVKCEITAEPEKKAKPAVKETMVSKCFVCDRPVGCAECGLPEGCDDSMLEHACICDECLSDPQAYKNYQEKFLKMVQKAAKVKI